VLRPLEPAEAGSFLFEQAEQLLMKVGKIKAGARGIGATPVFIRYRNDDRSDVSRRFIAVAHERRQRRYVAFA
jgi:hypothetical protein